MYCPRPTKYMWHPTWHSETRVNHSRQSCNKSTNTCPLAFGFPNWQVISNIVYKLLDIIYKSGIICKCYISPYKQGPVTTLHSYKYQVPSNPLHILHTLQHTSNKFVPLLSWFSLLYYVHGIGFFIQFSLAKGVLHAGRGSYIYFSYSTGAPLADIKLIILGFFCYSVFNNFFCYIKKFSYI